MLANSCDSITGAGRGQRVPVFSSIHLQSYALLLYNYPLELPASGDLEWGFMYPRGSLLALLFINSPVSLTPGFSETLGSSLSHIHISCADACIVFLSFFSVVRLARGSGLDRRRGRRCGIVILRMKQWACHWVGGVGWNGDSLVFSALYTKCPAIVHYITIQCCICKVGIILLYNLW